MNSLNRTLWRLLPSVDRVLNDAAVLALSTRHGRTAVAEWVRAAIQEFRDGPEETLRAEPDVLVGQVVERVGEFAQRADSQRLRKVINGTGIVIHTNLGRAPLAPAAICAMVAAAEGTNVEVDLSTGQRSRRGAAVEKLCRDVTGAEAALVVNNCAAATLLTLQTLAAGREVVISRGQLIEIGGSFRLPDVFRQAGVALHEVGTTNRTRIADYAQTIGPTTASLLRVHPSNYRVTGFCESASLAELVVLGQDRNLPVIDDVGSGCLYDLSRYGLREEPIVSESVRAGADLVLFSGDKLLGGPQCGIIVGKKSYIDRLRANPLARALRTDKLTLAALQGTLEIHRAGRAFTEIPVLRQLTMSAEEIHSRGEPLLQQVQAESTQPGAFSLQPVASAAGGGALPELTVPSWAIAISGRSADHIAQQLRLGNPAVFARVQDGLTLIDLRTVLPADESALVRCLLACRLE